jgi:hypothetical protein
MNRLNSAGKPRDVVPPGIQPYLIACGLKDLPGRRIHRRACSATSNMGSPLQVSIRQANCNACSNANLHASSCTLVAHEDCLLHWIAESLAEPTRAAKALSCPQCGAKYRIKSDRPPILKIMDFASEKLTRAAPYAAFLGTSHALTPHARQMTRYQMSRDRRWHRPLLHCVRRVCPQSICWP